MSIPSFYEERVRENGCEEGRNVAYNEDVAVEFEEFAFAAFDAQLFAVDRRSLTAFHVLDDSWWRS
jgi:hypothetical protein